MTRRARATFAAIGLIALPAGCGGSQSHVASTTSPPPAAAPPAASTPAPAPTTSAPATSAPANPALAHKPRVTKPRGPTPTRLEIKDLVVGKGPVARAGQMVSVQYVGVLFRNGQQFDASWDRNQPFPFQLGAGMVIPGWDQGVPGMHVGGRRELIIPARLAYGEQGPPGIGPNQALVFVIDLLSVQ